MRRRLRELYPVIGFLILAVGMTYGLYQVNEVANDAQELAEQNRVILAQLEHESAQRQTADRLILVRFCEQQQFVYKVMRGLIESDNREAAILLRRRVRVLQANGVDRGQLRRAINKNDRVLERLRPLDCENFARTVSVNAIDLLVVPALLIFQPPSPLRATSTPTGGGILGVKTGNPPVGGGSAPPPSKPKPPILPPPTPPPPPNPPPTGPGKGKSHACERAHDGKNKHC